MQRQRHQSVIREWRSKYINFNVDHSNITHKGRCSKSRVWGSWSWLFSPHDGDFILSASTAPLHCEHAVRTGRYCRKLVVIGPRRQRHVIPTTRDIYARSASFVQMARTPAQQGTAHVLLCHLSQFHLNVQFLYL